MWSIFGFTGVGLIILGIILVIGADVLKFGVRVVGAILIIIGLLQVFKQA
ncbi:MAG: hypothetical protein HY929_05900 [Euryarchaeota archaeon]|nr:hypothetical protein [Euryarchaeota archaeon]